MLDIDNQSNLHKGAAVEQDEGLWASAPASDDLLVILASGPEDGGKRATLALSAACSAARPGAAHPHLPGGRRRLLGLPAREA